ncbi:hypothetical protein FM102_01145 [Corynebacterium glutamicum]|nr:hypothetical protein FM102_01145 [Corynebacterium glutamicum]
MVFADKGSKNLSDKIGEVTWGVGGLCVHDLTLRPANIAAQELTKYY